MNKGYIDIHCHPSLKPYSKSFKYNPTGRNELQAKKKNSIWHYSPPNYVEKLLNRVSSLTKFSQSDMTTLVKANTSVVVVSLYPFEKHFLTKRILGWKGLTEVLVNLAAGISQKRMDNILNHKDYFKDLKDEYKFYLQLHNQVQKIDNTFYTYKIVENFDQIIENRNLEADQKKIINIILSIEGGHSLNTGLQRNASTASPVEVINNIKKLKNWNHKPLFITFAHHFYNELCGHARSLGIGLIKKNQNFGIDTDFTELGIKSLHLLLDNTEGKRILIDIKHMSRKSRITYYKLLDNVYENENIPIVVSHGAVNGRETVNDPTKVSYIEKAKWFNADDINFYDDEILKIAQSRGLFGFQLDERRIGSKKAVRKSKVWFPDNKKRLKKKAQLLWRQIEYMAVLLDDHNMDAWNIQAIGSDFDGIVDPLNGVWTSDNVADLEKALLPFANDFVRSYSLRMNQRNQLSPQKILDKVFRENAYVFLRNNY